MMSETGSRGSKPTRRTAGHTHLLHTVSSGLVVGAQALQQCSGAFRNVVHERLSIALHVALGLFERQAADVAQTLLIVLQVEMKGGSETWSGALPPI